MRGSPLLSEGTLLLLNLKSDQQAPGGARRRRTGADGRAVGAPSAHPLQLGLVGWIRGERPSRTSRFSKPSHTRSSRWRRGSRCSSSGGSSVRCRSAARRRPRNRRVGQATHGSRRSRNPAALHAGRGALRAEPARRAAEQSLYYIARATSDVQGHGRASFRLNELLNVDDSVEQERENLSAPSVKLMRTVSRPSARTSARSRTCWISTCAVAASRPSSSRRSACCARSATRSACWAWANCASWSSKRNRAGWKPWPPARRRGSRGAGAHRRHAHQCRGSPGSRSHRTHRSQATGRGPIAGSVDVDFQQVQAAVLRECSVNLVRVKAIASNGNTRRGARSTPGRVSSPASRPDC